MNEQHEDIKLAPIGVVRTSEDDCVSEIHIFKEFEAGLFEIEHHVFLIILWWAHLSAKKRDVLQFIPRLKSKIPEGKDVTIETHGVFSSRAPIRPNPIALSVVQLLERDGTVLKVRGLDAMPNTLVIDIKPYFLM